MKTFSQLDQRCIKLYLDYVNNFLTVQAFADHYDIDIQEANATIERGRELNNELAKIKL